MGNEKKYTKLATIKTHEGVLTLNLYKIKAKWSPDMEVVSMRWMLDGATVPNENLRPLLYDTFYRGQ